jgi:hypothetical protein
MPVPHRHRPGTHVFLLIEDLNVRVINAGHQQGETVIGAGPKGLAPIISVC